MDQKHKSYSNKTELALSALMFFAPLIQNLMKKNKLDKSEDTFLKWYIKLWYFNITLLILTIVFQITFYLKGNIIFQNIGFIISIILWISLSIWSIYAILNKEIFYNHKQQHLKQNKESLLDNILYYIPIYNVYVRYNEHKFENPNIILKESLLLRAIFTIILLIFPWENTIITIFLLLCLRIISIANWIYWWEKYSNIINKAFKKNPEEIWGYLAWILKTLFNWKKIKENIDNIKQQFEFIPKIDYKQILSQYLILIIVLWFLFYLWITNHYLNIIIASILITWRYWIMIIKRQHVPNIPILKEIVNLFFKNKN
jgi:hypothetical protein